MPVNTPDDSHFPETHEFSLSCSILINFPYSERCEQVLNTPECMEKEFFFNYIHLLYCGFKPKNLLEQSLSLIMFVIFMAIAFTLLGTVADKFFCPALKVFSLLFGMSEHLAGVTLLAFGNGSPDILTSLASMDEDDGDSFSSLMASGSFVSMLVAGLICLLYPFHMQAFNTLRDMLFLICAILLLEFINEDDVTYMESCYAVGFYIAYLATILLDQYLLTRSLKQMEELIGLESYASVHQQDILEQMKHEAKMDLIVSRVSVNRESTRMSTYNQEDPQNKDLIKQLLETLNPIDVGEWQHSSKFVRVLTALKAPLNVLLIVLVPCVDYELDRHGWSKLLNTIQIVTMPIIIIGLCFPSTLYHIPICLYSCCLTIPLAVVTFIVTRTDLPPRFHDFLGIYTIVGSIYIIYASANEVVNILDVMGVATGFSKAFLGSTVLSWGNSLGDLIANLTMARQGYQKMGFAACIGGPLFNALIGLGIPFMYQSLQAPGQRLESVHGMLGQNSAVFAALTLAVCLFGVLSTGFEGRRSIGVVSVIMYALCLLYAVLGEVGLIRTYATESIHGMP